MESIERIRAPCLPKMVYKRVNCSTSGRSLSLLNFVEYRERLNTSRQARARTTDYGFPLVGWQPRSQEISVRFEVGSDGKSPG